MFKKIFKLIRFYFWYFIIRPIKKIWNFVIYGAYLPDNERNQAIFDYCEKVIQDSNYQPSNPTEHWVDQQWRDYYKEINNKFIELNQHQYSEEELNIIIPPYDEYRIKIASQVLLMFNEYLYIKDK